MVKATQTILFQSYKEDRKVFVAKIPKGKFLSLLLLNRLEIEEDTSDAAIQCKASSTYIEDK